MWVSTSLFGAGADSSRSVVRAKNRVHKLENKEKLRYLFLPFYLTAGVPSKDGLLTAYVGLMPYKHSFDEWLQELSRH